jgi:hypothetical protein
MSSNAFADLGFASHALATEQQQPESKHQWGLFAQAPGVQRDKCAECGAFRTRTARSNRLPDIRYLMLGKVYQNAPPCRSGR